MEYFFKLCENNIWRKINIIYKFVKVLLYKFSMLKSFGKIDFLYFMLFEAYFINMSDMNQRELTLYSEKSQQFIFLKEI